MTETPRLDLPFAFANTPRVTHWFDDIGALAFDSQEGDVVTAVDDGTVVALAMELDGSRLEAIKLQHSWGTSAYKNGQPQSIDIELHPGSQVKKGDRLMRAGGRPLTLTVAIDGKDADPWPLLAPAYYARTQPTPIPPAHEPRQAEAQPAAENIARIQLDPEVLANPETPDETAAITTDQSKTKSPRARNAA